MNRRDREWHVQQEEAVAFDVGKETQKILFGDQQFALKEAILEGRDDAEARDIRGYCAAVRSALTDDGRPPLEASGLKLVDRLTAVAASLDRVAAKRGSRRS